ncbi:probable 2-oxoglutarate-dependent dioxygenase AOP1 isoform X1 [Olea europaea var. sylvestris]|uniref:probable 2-oxoglutarate-dependent dioxygenase AOP1 isoform X1 n=1 Tax=Olea europaea var. sylvestris TaxID=158386 RepID=UPI000C1CECA2|nr:probable 2-oxoglutarate-dependent dioxygenase AOP1 isoform X1 [Olea europaea var. sylvestris]
MCIERNNERHELNIMGSDAQSKLPIVDFREENLIPGTNSWVSTSNLVRCALESYGCFIALYEKITLEQRNEVFKSAKELFDLPVETKVKNISNFAGSGYGGNYPIMPLFEYMGIENGANLEATKNFTSIMWPDGNDCFCGTAHSYCKLLLELDQAVMEMVINSYGVQKYYNPLIQSSFYLTRFMKYRVPEENEINIGLIPHTDKNFLTIIDTNRVRGLEIETRDGEWIDYQPSPSTYLVMAGEPMMVRALFLSSSLSAWSNGRIHAALHRVVIRGEEEKYSIGNFSFINGMLQVPEELVDGENPLKFKPFSHPAFLEYCKEGGPTMENAIKTFCGF